MSTENGLIETLLKKPPVSKTESIDFDFLAQLLLRLARLNNQKLYMGASSLESRQPFTTGGGLQLNYDDPMTRFIASVGSR